VNGAGEAAVPSPVAGLIERYDRHAAPYVALWAPVLRVAGATLVGAVAARRPEVVIDVGAGPGTLAPDLKDAFPAAAIVAIDRSRGMLARAPTWCARSVMDATRLGLRTASADLVIAAFVLFHLDHPVTALREARRVLRRGGCFAALTWGGEMESAATRVWDECLEAHGAAPDDPAVRTRHEATGNPAAMEALMRDAGFATARAWGEELRHVIDADHLERLRTQMGSSLPRFESLDADARTSCLATARMRLAALAPDDFIARGPIVFSLGTV
jgi:ubiquinone/menaquinone biosynthesis C-methylase UbiE